MYVFRLRERNVDYVLVFFDVSFAVNISSTSRFA